MNDTSRFPQQDDWPWLLDRSEGGTADRSVLRAEYHNKLASFIEKAEGALLAPSLRVQDGSFRTISYVKELLFRVDVLANQVGFGSTAGIGSVLPWEIVIGEDALGKHPTAASRSAGTIHRGTAAIAALGLVDPFNNPPLVFANLVPTSGLSGITTLNATWDLAHAHVESAIENGLDTFGNKTLMIYGTISVPGRTFLPESDVDRVDELRIWNTLLSRASLSIGLAQVK